MEISLEERLHISVGCLHTLKLACERAPKKHIEVSADFLDVIQRVLEDCKEHIANEHNN